MCDLCMSIRIWVEDRNSIYHRKADANITKTSIHILTTHSMTSPTFLGGTASSTPATPTTPTMTTVTLVTLVTLINIPFVLLLSLVRLIILLILITFTFWPLKLNVFNLLQTIGLWDQICFDLVQQQSDEKGYYFCGPASSMETVFIIADCFIMKVSL